MELDRYTLLGFFTVIVAPVVLVLTLFVAAVDSDISFKNPFASKWMKGSDIIKMAGPLKDTPLIKSYAKMLDEYNGKTFCMPRMNEQEFTDASMMALMSPDTYLTSITEETKEAYKKYIDPKKPLEGLMIVGSILQYPCK